MILLQCCKQWVKLKKKDSMNSERFWFKSKQKEDNNIESMEKPNIYKEIFCWFFDLYLFLEFGYLDEMYVILNVWSFFNVHCYFWCENKIRNYIYQKSASEFLWEYNYAYLRKKITSIWPDRKYWDILCYSNFMAYSNL